MRGIHSINFRMPLHALQRVLRAVASDSRRTMAHYDKVPVHLKRPHGEIVFADSPQDQARRSLSKQV